MKDVLYHKNLGLLQPKQIMQYIKKINFRLFAASSLGYFDSLTQLDVDAVSWLHKKRK